MLRMSYNFLTITVLFMLSGCALFPKTPPASPTDPLIVRNQKWREYIAQGTSELENGNLRSALIAYQAAQAIRPDSSQTQHKIAQIYFQLEEYENARDAFVAALALAPNNIVALNAIGYISEKLNDYAAAAQYYERVLTISSDNLYALNHLGLAYKQLNRFDEALTMLRKALALDPKCQQPESQNLHNYLGLIYLEQGEVGEAIAELRESIRLFPQDVWARQQLASLYEDHQRYFEARLQYQQLLAVDPDNLLAVTRLQALSQLNPTPLQAVKVPPVRLLTPAVEEIIENAPDASDYPNADALILFNHFSHDVLPTGRSRYTTHQVVKLLTERGIQKYGDIAIPYQPNAQNIQVNIARTIAADGTELQPPDEAFNDVTPPGLLARNLYSDMMWRVISMVGLTPGVCIEYQVTLEDKTEQAAGSETWITGGYNFQGTEPTLETTYALRIPQAFPLQWKFDNSELTPKISYQENDTVVYIWHTGYMPPLKIEEGMPPINDIAPRLRYSTIASWNDVYAWYKELAKDRYAPDTHMAETVQHLTENLTTDAEKIRVIYHFVTKQIRYVGIELGQSAYQPTHATEVLQNRYGDCKDKTTLLITMLELAGIKAYPVMISAAPYERVNTDLPSLNQFNHMLAAIPLGGDNYIWMDATSDTCTYRDLPYRDQGRTGFLIGDTHGTFVDIPIFPAESNQLLSTTELWINRDGNGHGEIRIRLKGEYSQNARWTYQQVPPEEWKNTFAAELSQQFQDIHIEAVTISELSNLDVPVEISIGFQVSNHLTQLENRSLLPLPIDEFGDYAALVAAAERTYPLNMGHPMKLEKTIQIHLPAGWTVALPQNIQHDTDFATLERECTQLDNLVSYRLTFTLKRGTIPATAYSAAKMFFKQLSSEDGSRLLLNIERDSGQTLQ